MAARGRASIPGGLSWRAADPEGARWLAALPELIEDCARRWNLRVGEPVEGIRISWVAPVTLADGGEAILKVSFPGPDSEHEGAALRFWDGRGAALLLAEDSARRALLIERCRPGTPLWSVAEATACDAVASVFAALWRPAPAAGRFGTLAASAERWARVIPERWERHRRPCPAGLVESASELARGLGRSQPDQVLCHQDLHGGNIVADARGGWKAIDPQPIVGERAFDLASFVRDRRPDLRTCTDPGAILRRRIDVLTQALALDRERVAGWALVHALAWGLEDARVDADLLYVAGLIAAL